MTAGTVHPNPMSIGTILLPERPIFLKSLSITKATLAIYPLSSKRARNRNSVTIIGRKESTLPTPAKIPSMIRLCKVALTPADERVPSTSEVSASIPISKRLWRPAPITANVSQKTRAIMIINAGIAVYFPVRILSILSLRARSLLSRGFFTVCLTTFMINENLMSAIAALLSIPHSFSI